MAMQHSGASEEDIFDEPDWTETHSHRVGLRNRDDRFPGLTHSGDDWRFKLELEAEEKVEELREKKERGELLTVRDFFGKQEDFYLRRPEVHPKNWRYVLHTTEDFIKYKQDWLINQRNPEFQQKKREEPQKEDAGPKKEYQEPSYTPEQQATLDNIRQEKDYMSSLKSNDGKGKSPAGAAELPMDIDEIYQFTPDSWVPRSSHLNRLTGKHPLNGEPDLTELYESGLITPNKLHYVRNHGAVPPLLWENHRLTVTAGKTLVFFMDDLTDQFSSINIPIFLACDGNRRKELNMIKRSTGFNWGPGAMSCAYWKGVLLRDVLLKADVDQTMKQCPTTRLWVNFQGADSLNEGKYATCIPLDYAMEPNNDVLLAYEMNDSPLPTDHGYPLRLMIPGFVGGRCVKWLESIWVTDYENKSYYHINDNRVLPSFVDDKDSEFAKIMFQHPSTICNEQILNSIIARPAQGEKLNIAEMKKDATYRIAGVAYNGGGNEVQRVEISLDGGNRWLYCVRKYPNEPLRHGKKFWTWLFWHIDIDVTRFLRAESISVRCYNANNNTQPEKPTWNLTGMMNNCWYTVKPETIVDPNSNASCLIFRHPCEAGNGANGWMKPSREIQMESLRRQGSAPKAQFTREEIEKHHTERDCWIVVNGKVYNATGVLDWHPGGKTAIMAHAGRVHLDTTEEYESVHDNYAYAKLEECVLGVVTDKAMDFMRREARENEKQRSESVKRDHEIALKRHKWTSVRLVKKTRLSPNTQRYTFALSPPAIRLGLEIGQHLLLGFHFKDRLVIRSYTPTRPILEGEDDGTFDLVVKTYFPDPSQPGGTLSNILDCLEEGECVEVKGPAGEIRYYGRGRFTIDNKEHCYDRISLILGGSGITPGYQLIIRILSDEMDKTKIKLIDANRTEEDILLHEEFDKLAREHSDRLEVTHVLSHPQKGWGGKKGHVTEEILHQNAFEPGERNVAILCGPPTLIKETVLPGLLAWGYEEDRNVFGF